MCVVSEMRTDSVTGRLGYWVKRPALEERKEKGVGMMVIDDDYDNDKLMMRVNARRA